ncbi:hypothetical protein Q6239_03830, partial [Klebsiella pneumoniae]|uniref:hypothetical protein n=1 Tax=Klebsiella pneumoniae TaxID=573 RepID=UPI0039C3241B
VDTAGKKAPSKGDHSGNRGFQRDDNDASPINYKMRRELWCRSNPAQRCNEMMASIMESLDGQGE